MSYSRRSNRARSALKTAPQTFDVSGFFEAAFDELCAWLMEILHDGSIVSMTDLSYDYGVIIERRKEKLNPCMLRTSSI